MTGRWSDGRPLGLVAHFQDVRYLSLVDALGVRQPCADGSTSVAEGCPRRRLPPFSESREARRWTRTHPDDIGVGERAYLVLSWRGRAGASPRSSLLDLLLSQDVPPQICVLLPQAIDAALYLGEDPRRVGLSRVGGDHA